MVFLDPPVFRIVFALKIELLTKSELTDMAGLGRVKFFSFGSGTP
jgi:hypothetical protein